MTTEQLIADLRNKLSPIKVYLETQRQLEANLSKRDGGFIDGWKAGTLESKIPEMKLKAEQAFPQIEYILDLLQTPNQ